MHDLRSIRKDPDFYDKGWARRGLSSQSSTILELDEKHRACLTEAQEMQTRRNEISKQIGQAKSKGEDATALTEEVTKIKTRLPELEQEAEKLGNQIEELLASLPNIMQDCVPDGADDNDNVEVRRFGTPEKVGGNFPDHVDIGEKLGMLDFEAAARICGSRFVFVKSHMARLERALSQFMLDTHTMEHGYTEVSVPLMVKDNAVYGTTQLPKFAEDLFKTTNGFWLIPTAEVSLTNMKFGEILEEEELPLRLTACTPCFRSEAGSAGKDTRGMIRMHQFTKVEMVSITAADKSNEEHERMTECAENILKKLELPFRTVILCSGDTGFASTKTYDLEVWIPSQQKYREISSCSNCMDLQARRMKTRYRAKGEKETNIVHTLNGSGVAVGRALVAVMENYYDEAENCIHVPEVLKPYMGGITKIEAA